MKSTKHEQSSSCAAQETEGRMRHYLGMHIYDPSRGTASSSFTYWDGGTFVTETLRRHKGHEFTVTERIRVEDNRLIYKHEITGPGKKHDEREINFEIP